MEDWHTTYCVKEKRKTGCTEPSGSSMLKGVLSQPNFSPQTNATQ